MAKNVNAPETDVVVNTKGKLENLFEKYGKALLWVLVVVAVAVGGYFIYKSYSEKKVAEKKEALMVKTSQALVAGGAAEAIAIADNKENANTASANFANYLAAARYLAEGDIDAANERISKFVVFEEGDLAAMINAAAYGVRGDIAVERGDYKAAIAEFEKAIKASDDMHTFVTYNEKAARVYSAMLNDNASAMKYYKAIVAKYPEKEGKYAKYIW